MRRLCAIEKTRRFMYAKIATRLEMQFQTLFLVNARLRISVARSATPSFSLGYSRLLLCATIFASALSLSSAAVVVVRSSPFEPRHHCCTLFVFAERLGCPSCLITAPRCFRRSCTALLPAAGSHYARIIKPRNVANLKASIAFVIKSASISMEQTCCARMTSRCA